jgi:hypothetical protein
MISQAHIQSLRCRENNSLQSCKSTCLHPLVIFKISSSSTTTCSPSLHLPSTASHPQPPPPKCCSPDPHRPLLSVASLCPLSLHPPATASTRRDGVLRGWEAVRGGGWVRAAPKHTPLMKTGWGSSPMHMVTSP